MSILLETHNLAVAVAGKVVCRDLNLVIKRGECWGILGRNGIGKTTLLHTLAGLRAAHAGVVHLLGQPLAAVPRRHIAQTIGMLFQHTEDPFPATVQETTLIGRHPYLSAWGWESEEDHRQVRQALAQMHLAELASRQVDTLSGGERQRLALAALLTQAPQIFMLDEPANHLDLHHQIMVMDLLVQQTREQGKALIMVVHDLNMTARYCDHVLLLLGNGQVLHGKMDEMMTQENLENLYGHPIQCIEVPGKRIFLAG